MEEITKEKKTDATVAYLSFYLDNEQYAVLVSKVIEILGVPRITKIPDAPKYMIGVINLRGSVIPIVDIKTKFNINDNGRTSDTCIIVMRINFNGKNIVMGILADQVDEVLNLTNEQISEPPSLGVIFNKEFLVGMAKVNDNFLMLLDINAIMDKQDSELIESIAPVDEKTEAEKENKKG
jgi:purine-binding chemotaxis protein CheW